MKQPFIERQLELKRKGEKPAKPNILRAGPGLFYDADRGAWIRDPTKPNEEETNPLHTLRRLAGLDAEGTAPGGLDPVNGVPSETRVRPNLMTAVRGKMGLSPNEQVMMGTTAKGEPQIQVRERPRAMGDVNALVQELSSDFMDGGMDPVQARAMASELATEFLAKRRAAAERATQKARNEPEIVAGEAKRTYTVSAAGAQGEQDVTNRPALPVGQAYGPPTSPGSVTAPPPVAPQAAPQATPQPVVEPPGMSQGQAAAFRRTRGTESAQNIPQQLVTDTAATLLVNKQLAAIETSPVLTTYGWSQQQWRSGLRDWVSGATKGIVPNDPEFIKFRQQLRNIRLQAFDFGGKQLTNTEKEFVLQTVPDGSENTPVELRDKIKGLRERREVLLNVWQQFANTPTVQYDMMVNKAIREYLTQERPGVTKRNFNSQKGGLE
jgi:hypothetical protein